ncbi:hypothetical protein EV363DRAFT_330652 [Boletus edulis]|nr:hypothetical protein EV363DRAFT_330652 [Boletus edulis]
MSAVPGHDEQRRSASRPSKLTTSDYAIGICLLLVVVFLWTSSNFVTQYMVTGGYKKPFMITYLSTAAFTLYLLPSCLRKSFVSRRRNTNYQPLSQDLPGEHDSLTARSLREVHDRFTPEETAKLAVYFCFLWFAANWTLNAALAYTSVASATILSGMSGIFTLAVGRIFRVETLTMIKVAAVLTRHVDAYVPSPAQKLTRTSFGGVVLVSLSDSSSSPAPTANAQSTNSIAILGDILALLSALFYALYMIFLKVQIMEESRIDMQLFFGYVGVFNVSLLWPVALLLHWFGVESLEWPGTKEVVMGILVNMFITLSSDYIYVIAMLKTTPLVVTVGLSLTIPLAVIGDYFLGKPSTFQVLVGAVLVTCAFVVVGVENSKSRESDGLLAQGLAGEGIEQRSQLRLDGAVPLGSQTHAFDA